MNGSKWLAAVAAVVACVCLGCEAGDLGGDAEAAGDVAAADIADAHEGEVVVPDMAPVPDEGPAPDGEPVGDGDLVEDLVEPPSDMDGPFEPIGQCAEPLCGSPGEPADCWCDEACFGHGDCCTNVCDVCDLAGCGQVDPSPCDGLCGEQNEELGCSCSEACFEAGDCCEDICNVCEEFHACWPAYECGDGECAQGLGGEDCHDCPEDCGDCGSCCEDKVNAGCNDPEVENCVCEIDPYCCEVKWDALCVEEVDGEACGMCSCGDAVCDAEAGETCDNCPGDCGECCGDGICSGIDGENCFTCDADCGSCCGDGLCNAEVGEDCHSCVEDCGDCCGDGICVPGEGEDCFTCDADCGSCAICGDFICEPSEECESCEDDCGICVGGCCEPHGAAGPGCDDKGCQEIVCAIDEYCCATGWDTYCVQCASGGPGFQGLDCSPADEWCGCTFDQCGDGFCNGDEVDLNTCPDDCMDCGDGICDGLAGESCGSCADDCGDCCGDGICDGPEGENCDSCVEDCFVDGGDGQCVDAGTCSDGYHDGGDGVCVPDGQCSDGYHDGGDGVCVPEGSCSQGYHDGGLGGCVPLPDCEGDYVINADGDCVYPTGSLPFVGQPEDLEGVAGWSTDGTGADPLMIGHPIPAPWNTCDGGGFPYEYNMNAYYFIASPEHAGLIPGSTGAAHQSGQISGFPKLAAALDSTGLDPAGIALQFGPMDLGADVEGQDWDFDVAAAVETRTYTGGTFALLIDGHTAVTGSMPDLFLTIDYVDLGGALPNGCTDDIITAITSYLPHADMVDETNAAMPSNVGAVAQAFLADAQGMGSLRVVFDSVQSAGQQEFGLDGAVGAIFDVQALHIE